MLMVAAKIPKSFCNVDFSLPDSLVLPDEAGVDDILDGGEPLPQPRTQPPDTQDVRQQAVPKTCMV